MAKKKKASKYPVNLDAVDGSTGETDVPETPPIEGSGPEQPEQPEDPRMAPLLKLLGETSFHPLGGKSYHHQVKPEEHARLILRAIDGTLGES